MKAVREPLEDGSSLDEDGLDIFYAIYSEYFHFILCMPFECHFNLALFKIITNWHFLNEDGSDFC